MCFSIHVSKFIFFPHSARNIHLPLREIRIIKSKMHTRKRVNFQLWLQKFYFWVPTNRIVLTILWVSESGLPNWFYSFAANHRINNARGGDREIPDMQKGEEPSSSSPSGTQKGRDKKKKKKKKLEWKDQLPLFSIFILHSHLGEDVRNQTTPMYVFRKWSLMWHHIQYTWLTMVEKTSV